MIKIFKYVYILPFILSWIYIFIYPLINKIFKLNLKTDYTVDEYFKMFFTSITPILNILALYLAIVEDIEAFMERRREKK